MHPMPHVNLVQTIEQMRSLEQLSDPEVQNVRMLFYFMYKRTHLFQHVMHGTQENEHALQVSISEEEVRGFLKPLNPKLALKNTNMDQFKQNEPCDMKLLTF